MLAASIPFSVPSTTPIRIAGRNDPPFRIINQGVSGTVWLSRNSGVTPGQGTPLHPGTSVLWTEPAELFAISDVGLTVDIILTTEVEDWQPDPAAIATAILNSGVLIVDNPLEIITPGLILPSGGSVSTDTSRYQSLILSVAGQGGNTASSECLIDYPSVGHRIRISLAANGLGWAGTLPLMGEDLTITSSNGTMLVNAAVLSHRPYAGSFQRIFGSAPTFYLVKNSLFVPNGTTASLPPIRPFFGDIDIHVFAALSVGAAGTFASPGRVILEDSNGDTIWQEALQSTFGPTAGVTGNWRLNFRIPNQGDQWTLSIANTFTAPTTITAQIHINPVESIVG